MTSRPLIITPGEPAGIGSEIALKAWKSGTRDICLIEQPAQIAQMAASLGITAKIREIDGPASFDSTSQDLHVIPISWETAPVAGAPDTCNAPQVIRAIQQAVLWSQTGIAAGIVTNPIHKSSLYDAGFAYPGHTEFLASLSKPIAGAPLMMLACDELRVVPATIHIALNKVPAAISAALIIKKCQLLHACLKTNFGIDNPHIAVCGLNPHAGENGNMGDEDTQIILPAIAKLQTGGINATGPHPADTLFHSEARKTYDVVLGMYHDQVLIPLKTIDFFGGVNVTLGLDFIRTSPDHGTGLDIAGRGIARADSLIAAIKMARNLADNSQNQKAN
ncbi:4-hydroxythreonine-4-phosphate dehydrogenase PdxA [Alphaproteobacteria bacterium]|nr:4-hydroxythreonine-4-phosphate dehydrogenase PdxA [Alphaproteobacteria bacterium]